jgi:hypothetical protein
MTSFMVPKVSTAVYGEQHAFVSLDAMPENKKFSRHA